MSICRLRLLGNRLELGGCQNSKNVLKYSRKEMSFFMKCTLHIDPQREEEVLIYAREESPLTEAILRLCKEGTAPLLGYREDEIRPLEVNTVSCFMTEGGKCFAVTEEGKWQVKLRLWQLEELLGEDFLKINQSCLANISRIKRFHASFGGALLVTFVCGYGDYVSRRQLKQVKERMGIVK